MSKQQLLCLMNDTILQAKTQTQSVILRIGIINLVKVPLCHNKEHLQGKSA